MRVSQTFEKTRLAMLKKFDEACEANPTWGTTRGCPYLDEDLEKFVRGLSNEEMLFHATLGQLTDQGFVNVYEEKEAKSDV